ncbi:MAG: hypothetical protein PHD19_11750 [Dechloromonas sp.]|nr:hypothetical protein [Dechloromonas sp.]
MAQSNAEKEFELAVLRFIEESPKRALSAITGYFVGLTIALIEGEGHAGIGEIRINSGGGRDITIHAEGGGR